jgi:hypothetical protein
MSVAQLEALYDAAVSAIDDESWGEAVKILTKLGVRLAATPNVSRNLGGGGSQSIQWNAGTVQALLAFARQQQAASQGIQESLVRYVRPNAASAYTRFSQ